MALVIDALMSVVCLWNGSDRERVWNIQNGTVLVSLCTPQVSKGMVWGRFQSSVARCHPITVYR